MLDRKGERFAEVFEENQRRVWVVLSDIPEQVQKAFVAAEDKRFYQHKGIDERGLIRAFIGNLASSGRPQGGSTITQQVVKNLLVGEDLTYERKIREMIVASRVEQTLTKPEILELYLNSVYLGRGSWGIELAARSYFGKPAKELTLEEGALLAGLTKGPNYFSPDRHPGRAQERFAYVLSRLREDGVIPDAEPAAACRPLPAMVAYERPRRDIGYHFVDQVAREAKALAGIDAITANSYTVRSTIHPQLQRAVEEALQEGLVALRAQRRTRAVRRRRGQPRASDPQARSGEEAGRTQAGLATGARECAAAALRRALDAGGRGREARRQEGRGMAGRSARRAHPAAHARRRDRAAQARALRRRAGAVTEGQGQGRRCARRAAGAAARCRAPRSCWRTRPAASWPCRAASPIR